MRCFLFQLITPYFVRTKPKIDNRQHVHSTHVFVVIVSHFVTNLTARDSVVHWLGLVLCILNLYLTTHCFVSPHIFSLMFLFLSLLLFQPPGPDEVYLLITFHMQRKQLKIKEKYRTRRQTATNIYNKFINLKVWPQHSTSSTRRDYLYFIFASRKLIAAKFNEWMLVPVLVCVCVRLSV